MSMVIVKGNAFQKMFLVVLGVIIMTAGMSRAEQLAPPVAKIEPKVDTIFGDVLIDNYHWLRNRGSKEVLDYLKAENEYTQAMMAGTEKLQKTLYEEMVGRIKETDLSVPVKEDDYYYYYRTEEGKQYRIYCRKKGSLEAPEEVLLDLNKLAEGKEFLSLGVYDVSPDHQLLAYSIDTTGNEKYTLYIKNLKTQEILPEKISNTSDIAWANDNRTIFYSVEDAAHRPYRLYRHKLRTEPAQDPLIYEEKDDAYFLSIGKTKDKRFLILSLGSMVTSEAHVLDADNPTGTFRVIHPRQHEMEYSVEHHGNKFLIVTNLNAKNFRLVEAPEDNPGVANWKEVIPYSYSIKIDDIDVFKDYLVVYERVNGLKSILVHDFRTGTQRYIQFDEPVYAVYGGQNPDYNSEWLRFTYMSLITPRSVYDYNMATHERILKKQTEVLGGYDPNQYTSERIFATARDGVKVPVSLVYRKGITRNGKNPLFLYGYGAYGVSMDPYFSSSRISLLDRGFIYAIAHIRGGGEMGRQWYEDGKLLKKKNTFTDFIDCGDYLVKQKYTSHDKMVISGGSAGGLLIGAVLNMRPDLAAVAIADVPFVDLINTMMDPSLPLTVIEYEEWGNPHKKKYYEYMRSYSPYDNVGHHMYPNLLVEAGLNDARVQYWEPAKWVAKLRANKTDNNLLLLKTNMGAGHGGASGRYDYLKEIAFEYAFVLHCLGMDK